MSWLALLLVGLAVTDLARGAQRVAGAIGALVLVMTGLAAGLTSGRDAAAYAVLAGVCVGWGVLAEGATDRRRAGSALVLLGAATAGVLLASPLAPSADGLVGRWLASCPWPLLATTDADRLLLLAGVLGVQLSTGNTVVRLVLAASGTTDPVRRDPAEEIKGGRLLGPMERVFIVGLGLAGHVTAASLVIAAKGLIRWPELASKRDHARDQARDQAHDRAEAGSSADIDEVTEYFLVGSFVSWLVALASLVVLAR